MEHPCCLAVPLAVGLTAEYVMVFRLLRRFPAELLSILLSAVLPAVTSAVPFISAGVAGRCVYGHGYVSSCCTVNVASNISTQM